MSNFIRRLLTLVIVLAAPCRVCVDDSVDHSASGARWTGCWPQGRLTGVRAAQ